jgi:hypothetical protein
MSLGMITGSILFVYGVTAALAAWMLFVTYR